MRKCNHGVYIPERLGLSDFSDGCSVCVSEAPVLDSHYGVLNEVVKRPKTVSDAYTAYKNNPCQATHDALYHVITRFALGIAKRRFVGKWYIPSWGMAARDAASDCLMNIDKYDPLKASFSTWAHQCITNDIKKWLDREIEWDHDSIDSQSRPIVVVDPGASLDEKLLLKEIKALMTDDERKLFEMRATNMTWKDIGTELEIPLMTAYNRFVMLTNKIRKWSARPTNSPLGATNT